MWWCKDPQNIEQKYTTEIKRFCLKYLVETQYGDIKILFTIFCRNTVRRYILKYLVEIQYGDIIQIGPKVGYTDLAGEIQQKYSRNIVYTVYSNTISIQYIDFVENIQWKYSTKI